MVYIHSNWNIMLQQLTILLTRLLMNTRSSTCSSIEPMDYWSRPFIHLHREGISTHHLCLLMHRRCCKAMAFNACTPSVVHCRVRLLVGVTLGEGRQNQKVNFRFWDWGNSTGKTIPSNAAALMNATQLVIFDVLKIRDKEDVPNAHYHVLAYS